MPCNFRIPEACTIRNCFQGQIDFAAFITSCLQCLTSIFPGQFFFFLNPCRDHLLWGTSFDSSLVCESWPCLCHCFHLSFSASVVMQNREIVHGLSLCLLLCLWALYSFLYCLHPQNPAHMGSMRVCWWKDRRGDAWVNVWVVLEATSMEARLSQIAFFMPC